MDRMGWGSEDRVEDTRVERNDGLIWVWVLLKVNWVPANPNLINLKIKHKQIISSHSTSTNLWSISISLQCALSLLCPPYLSYHCAISHPRSLFTTLPNMLWPFLILSNPLFYNCGSCCDGWCLHSDVVDVQTWNFYWKIENWNYYGNELILS